MRRGAFLVNTAGGTCVDTADLIAALDAGHLAGAALDVFDIEPPPREHPLLHREDVLVTPHLAGAADDVVRHHTEMICARSGGAAVRTTAGAVREPGGAVIAGARCGMVERCRVRNRCGCGRPATR
jgi:phosphoglycerate dehydrogenase-like enzyme